MPGSCRSCVVLQSNLLDNLRASSSPPHHLPPSHPKLVSVNFVGQRLLLFFFGRVFAYIQPRRIYKKIKSSLGDYISSLLGKPLSISNGGFFLQIELCSVFGWRQTPALTASINLTNECEFLINPKARRSPTNVLDKRR
jgi:hypothetical protein